MQDEWLLAYVTTENVDQAEQIGKSLVLDGLAGCINILPRMKSMYIWKGRLESSEEAVLLVKTHYSRKDDVENRILQLHSYETPCILFLPFLGGNQKYLQWLGEGCLRPPAG